MIIGYIYKITNKINNKSYVGLTTSSVRTRWYKHTNKSSGCSALANAIKKYGRENFELTVIDTAISLEELKKKESVYIQQENTIAPNGYNLTTGGEASSPSKEVRLKIAKALEERARPEAVRRKLSIAHTGKKRGPCSEEVRNKISTASKGRKLTDDHRKKLSEAKKNKPVSLAAREKSREKTAKKIQCVETGDIYNSVTEASATFGIDVSWICKICKGKQKTAKGYSFKYFIEAK